jgi:hypothetical protein
MATCSMEGSGSTIRILYPGYCGSSVTAHKSRYGRFPPVASGWGTIHPIPDVAPPLLAREDGPPTKRELDSGMNHT